jgi:hypothetical protein
MKRKYLKTTLKLFKNAKDMGNEVFYALIAFIICVILIITATISLILL